MSARAARTHGRGEGPPEPASRRTGVTLDALEAEIRARASVRAWGAFVEAVRMSPIPDTKGGYSAYFYALPADRASLMYIYGELRPTPKDRAVGQLRLRWELLPEGAAPQRIKRSSHEVGGWPEVLRRLDAAWPAQRLVEIDVGAAFVVDTRAHTLVPALRLKPEPKAARGYRLTQTAAAWEIDPPSGGVHRISVSLLRAHEIVVAASARLTSTLRTSIGEELEQVVWEGVKTFLRAP